MCRALTDNVIITLLHCPLGAFVDSFIVAGAHKKQQCPFKCVHSTC